MSKVLHSIGVILGMSYAVAEEPGEIESLGITGDGAKGFRAMASGQSATLRRLMTDLALKAAKSSDKAVLVDLESFAAGVIEGMEQTKAKMEGDTTAATLNKEPTEEQLEELKSEVNDFINKLIKGG